MNFKLAACLLILVLLVGWVLFLVGGGRDSNARVIDERPAAAAASEPERSLVADNAPVPASAPNAVAREEAVALVDSAAPGSWLGELAGLTGRVVESDGRPVAGMRVALIQVDPTELFDGAAIDAEQPKLELDETLTDDKGRFVLGGAYAPSFHGLGVDLGGPRATIRVIDHALPHRERTDIGDVVLAPYGVLTGRVVDDGGAPVPGARVRVGPFPEEILRGSPQEFRSDSLIAISLLMMGGEGHGIIELPSWILSAVDRFPVPTTQSAADGTFRLEGVALAKVVGGIDKRGYVGVPLGPIDMSGATSSAAKDLGDVVLKHGRTVHGVVEDPYGEPVPGVEVHAGAEIVAGIVAILQPCGKTDAEGKFSLDGVAESAQVVAAARRAPHEPWSTTVTSRYDNVVLEIKEAFQLTVNVRDEQGKPLSGVRMQLAPAHGTDRGRDFDEFLLMLPKPPSPASLFREVEPGRYVAADLGAALYDVTARAPGLAPAHALADCRASASEITLTCVAGSLIDLQVIDSATKAPVPGARASVLRVGAAGFSKLVVASTDMDGRARLGPLAELAAAELESSSFPAETMLLVQQPRYGDYSAEFDPKVSPLVVALQSGGSLAGRVHWGGAIPTRLYMLSLEYRGENGFLEAFHMPRFSVTDLGGEFHLANLIPGTYNASLSERFLNQDPLGLMNDDFSIPTLHEEKVEIRNGETTELVIDLGPTGRGPTARIVGRVRLDGHNLEGAEVRVQGNENVHVVTDASGRFETAPFSVRGSVSVNIQGDVRLADGRTRRTQLHAEELKLAQDEVHQIDLDLYPLTLRVRVVEAASGEPVPGAEVRASLKDRETGDSSVANPSGDAELIALEPGEYSVTAHAPGFGSASSEVKVLAGSQPETTVVKLSRSVPCAGRVQMDASMPSEGRGFAYLQVQGVDNADADGARLVAPDYTFKLDDLSAGKYRGWIYIGGQRGEVSFVLGPEGQQDLVLTFTPSKE